MVKKIACEAKTDRIIQKQALRVLCSRGEISTREIFTFVRQQLPYNPPGLSYLLARGDLPLAVVLYETDGFTSHLGGCYDNARVARAYLRKKEVTKALAKQFREWIEHAEGHKRSFPDTDEHDGPY